MDLLIEALTYHSDGYTVGDITVKVCWDADRLDLGHVGIRPAREGSVQILLSHPMCWRWHIKGP